MRRQICFLAVLLALLSACGRAEGLLTVRPGTSLTGRPSTPSVLVAGDRAVALSRYLAQVRWAAIVRFARADAGAVVGPYSARYQPSPTRTTTTGPVPVGPPSHPSPDDGLAPCGGDLPPCWRVTIESRRTWDAYNPTGCYRDGRAGCYGPYQFGWFWGGLLGLPDDLATATHEQWVAAARELWAGGAGCAHWDACN